MITKVKRKIYRTIKRWLKNRNVVLMLFIGTLLLGMFIYTEYMNQNRRLTANPATYTQLLHLIAKAESRGNYNAYFGNTHNSSIKFTAMSIKEVLKWQSEYVKQGSVSSAVGRYQFLDTTLKGLVKELKIDTRQPFDQATQDKLAATLIERRGAEAYVNGELTREKFAANLAKEWASLPRIIGKNASDSYYASDGLNKSLIGVDEVLGAIAPITHK